MVIAFCFCCCYHRYILFLLSSLFLLYFVCVVVVVVVVFYLCCCRCYCCSLFLLLPWWCRNTTAKLFIPRLLLSAGCSKQPHVVVKTAAELLSEARQKRRHYSLFGAIRIVLVTGHVCPRAGFIYYQQRTQWE